MLFIKTLTIRMTSDELFDSFITLFVGGERALYQTLSNPVISIITLKDSKEGSYFEESF